ncbi:hypothetical protein HPB52_024309 [Rhipicephalus sanguineus]|uniref:Uncharacterized protein n=1 Tax=Rhipicephalus sanguineus TaxID=34632 RepID=A0A9D4YR44_RHISA|nr:hypothetical protein HPB52_024309 [Rhipicephalus sanguineus]
MIRYTNRILRIAIMVAYGGNLVMLCGIAYCLVDPTSTWSLRIFCFCYGFLITLDMVDVGFLVESLKLQGPKNFVAKNYVVFQGFRVRFLHDCLDSDQMCLSACGFFKVNLTLLVSIERSIHRRERLLLVPEWSAIRIFPIRELV